MDTTRFWRRSLKALHEIAALGLGGGLAACLAINLRSTGAGAASFLASREAFEAIASYVLVPSLAAVLISGLLAIAANPGFHSAGWAWLKALFGVSVFEATLITVGASHSPEELAATAADPALLASLLSAERNTLLLLIGIAIANVVLAVWRPKLMITIR